MNRSAWCAGLLVLGAFLLLGTGCSTPQSRSQERASSFEKLSQDDQRLVLKGKIREGLDEDAVYVAMGHPSRRTRGQRDGKEEVSWIYSRLESRVVPAFTPQVVFVNGRRCIRDVYTPITDTYLVDAFEVMFREGKVVGWREL
ncbi:MAG: hypothetical protein SFU85_02780 [Candidatus Methylacidiphilales bacterium]|nr:hypothetical protein [Candidatus Methylacidiphilales bacterium]